MHHHHHHLIQLTLTSKYRPLQRTLPNPTIYVEHHLSEPSRFEAPRCHLAASLIGDAVRLLRPFGHSLWHVGMTLSFF